MMIPLKNFTGEFPRLAHHLLPDNAAQLAQDCDFSRGTLTGLSNPDPVAGVSGTDIRAFFVYEGGAAAGKGRRQKEKGQNGFHAIPLLRVEERGVG